MLTFDSKRGLYGVTALRSPKSRPTLEPSANSSEVPFFAYTDLVRMTTNYTFKSREFANGMATTNYE